jgi:hypothetical protein
MSGRTILPNVWNGSRLVKNLAFHEKAGRSQVDLFLFFMGKLFSQPSD